RGQRGTGLPRGARVHGVPGARRRPSRRALTAAPRPRRRAPGALRKAPGGNALAFSVAVSALYWRLPEYPEVSEIAETFPWSSTRNTAPFTRKFGFESRRGSGRRVGR